MSSTFSLASHAALVTGSSQGIGAAIAAALRDAGAAVVYHGLQPAGAAAGVPAGADYVQLDLLAPDGPAALVAAAFAAQPALDTLVCNAGGFFDVPFLDMTRERLDRTLALNLSAPYFIVQAFARRLAAARRGGSVVITASTNGFQAEVDSTAYDASKGALVMLVRSLAVSLAPLGIRVNGVAPGLIRTPLTAGWMDAAPETVAHYERATPLGRIGEPADVAGAAVFLCAPRAAGFVTGEVIVVDGGLTVLQIGKMPGPASPQPPTAA